MVAPTEMVTWICEPSTGTVDRATSALHLSDMSARMSFVTPGRITKNSSPPPTSQHVGRTQTSGESLCNSDQRSISGDMPVGIVDVLEVVQVDQHDSERCAELGMLIELLKELLLQIATVCHLGCWIQKSQLRELPGSLLHGPLPGVVTEDLDRTDNFTVSARNWANTNLHGDPVATFMVKINVQPARTTIRYGTAERALSLTEQAPGVVDVHQDVVGTAGAYNFFGAVSGKVFRCSVPVRNPTLQISEVDTVKKVVQNPFVETVHFI